ncbi:DNA mismatch repair protein Msh3 [Strongylocentrotus purpuratus]|uniref:DNA mismatch repair protein MSH3 n=1 Tax=Strongylocentrotus purpuratus TaxID=7668 RepID=A0A7M7N710_STRPU|nr:DNA mismatch repair protein Msh3 [Strongylocentrotus purpuratus]
MSSKKKVQPTLSRFFTTKSTKKVDDTSKSNGGSDIISTDSLAGKRPRSIGEDEDFQQNSPKQLKLDGKVLHDSDSRDIPPLSAGTLQKLNAFALASSHAESESRHGMHGDTNKPPLSPSNISSPLCLAGETEGPRSPVGPKSETIQKESRTSTPATSISSDPRTPSNGAQVTRCKGSPKLTALKNKFSRHSGSSTISSPRVSSTGFSDNVSGKTSRVKKSQYTPLEQQFMKIKESYTDTVLLVECGYRYRFFGEDAEIASRDLNIFCHLDHNFMTASIPTHRLFVHVRRLVAKGHKVGVVKQMETAALKAAGDNKGQPFERKLTALYTKSTLIGEDLEPSSQNGQYAEEQPAFSSSPTSYLLCVCELPKEGSKSPKKDHIQIGLAAVQPATGDVIYDSFHDNGHLSELDTRLHHIQPVELLLPETLSDKTEKLLKDFRMSSQTEDRIRIERLPADVFQYTSAVEEVSSFYGNQTETQSAKTGVLQSVLSLPKPVICCLAALLKYLKEFNLHRILQATSNMRAFNSSQDTLRLDACAFRNLEIFQNQVDGSEKGTLLWVLNHTKTRYGKRQLMKWLSQPLTDVQDIESRLEAVTELLDSDSSSLDKLCQVLSRSPDVERGLCSIYHKKCSPAEFVTVTRALSRLSLTVKTLRESVDIKSVLLKDILIQMPSLLEGIDSFLASINEKAVRDGDKTKLFADPSQFPSVHQCMQDIEAVKSKMAEHRQRLRKEVAMPTADYVTVSGNEYMIEVKNSQVKKVPKDWLQISGTKQVSRYRPPYVEESFKRLCQLREQLAADCQNAWLEFLESFGENYFSYRRAVQHLASFDCLLSLATVSKQDGYCRPTIHDGPCKIDIKGGRHPVVSTLKADGDQYVPNDTSINVDGLNCMIITGPNMGGKSSYIKQVALITIMAQLGSYVPAESASIGAVDAIFTRMGASDDIFRNRSTFMSELLEASDIMAKATCRSLVIMDELGRGTSTHDGVAIAFATARHLIEEVKCLTLFVTHYPPLAELSDHYPTQVGNFHMSFLLHDAEDEDPVEKLTFLYQLVDGVAGRSYGLNVARLADIPDAILEKASSKSHDLEKSVTVMRSAKEHFTNLWRKLSSDPVGPCDVKQVLASLN